MHKRIILFQPRVDTFPHYACFWAPIALLAIAGPLIDNGYDVKIIDGNLFENDQIAIEDDLFENLLFIGISLMIGGNQIERGIDFAKKIRKKNPKITIIVGGPATCVIPNLLINHDAFDVVVVGQGEIPIVNVAKNLTQGLAINDIPGVITKNKELNRLQTTANREQFPVYPWHLIDVEKYIRNDAFTGKRTLNYISSQGCPNKCGYCSEELMFKSKWVSYSAERTVSESLMLVSEYGLSGIKFYDSNFFADTKRVQEYVYLKQKSHANFLWSASAHPREIIRLGDELSLLRDAGLRRLLIGFESGHQPTLDYVTKGTKVEDNLKVAEICEKTGVSATYTYIVGFPGISDDTEATINQAKNIKRINPSSEVNIHFYYPFPGTRLYQKAIEFGFPDAKTLEDFSNNDYYLIQTPWVNPLLQKKVNKFQRTVSL